MLAAVCENDLIAIELMRALRQADLHVPANISLVGFDNIQAAALVDPALTTIGQNFAEMGRLAGNQVIEKINAAKAATPVPTETTTHLVAVSLIKRESTQLKE